MLFEFNMNFQSLDWFLKIKRAACSNWAATVVRRNVVVKAFVTLVPGVDVAPAKSRQSTAMNACWWCGAPGW